MGYKPVVIGEAIGTRFAEQDKPFSISVDTINLNDTTPFRVFLQIEPPEIQNIVDSLIQNHKFYDVILAWNEDILKACPNAIKFPFGSCWVHDHTVDVNQKKFEASFLTSGKNSCAGHRFRQQLFSRIPGRVGDVTIHKHQSPPRIPDKGTILKPYQYTIAVENTSRDNWFTEKLIDCFVSRTVPLYYGCPNIAEYFDIAGMFTFKTQDELEATIRTLTSKTYFDMYSHVENNYNKALEYVDIWVRVDKIIRERL